MNHGKSSRITGNLSHVIEKYTNQQIYMHDGELAYFFHRCRKITYDLWADNLRTYVYPRLMFKGKDLWEPCKLEVKIIVKSS
jgi:hypothetical protein